MIAAAGVSERGGERYYFCSTGCKAKFDAGKAHPPEHHADAHANHRMTPAPAGGHDAARDAGAEGAEDAPEASYRALMRKFWFAAAVGVPLLLLMFAEFVPSWRDALMPYHRLIGFASALVTLPVLAWSGRQFFESAWNGLLNHNTNMDTLVALGTGAAWLYSAAAVVAPGLFPAGTSGMYFEVAGRSLCLHSTRRETTPCGEEVVLPEFGRRAHLPENQTVSVEVTPREPGEYEFTCGMNMYKDQHPVGIRARRQAGLTARRRTAFRVHARPFTEIKTEPLRHEPVCMRLSEGERPARDGTSLSAHPGE